MKNDPANLHTLRVTVTETETEIEIHNVYSKVRTGFMFIFGGSVPVVARSETLHDSPPSWDFRKSVHDSSDINIVSRVPKQKR